MLLRNKKTGQEGNFIINKDHFECVDLDCVPLYFSLSELLDEWEDYKPKEPLIKDEKVRKAVRAWAEANRVAEARYSSCHDAECEFNARDDENKSIVFIGNFTEMNKELDYSGRTIYAIEELCGEEEE